MANVQPNIILNIEGMTCTNCALGVSRVIQKAGAKNVDVNFSTGEASFYLNDAHKLKSFIADINGLGYKVRSADEQKKEERFSAIEKKFFFCLIFTITLLLHMVLPFDWIHNPIVQLSLTIPVMIIGGWHFIRSAWSSLKTFVPNMDVLIAIGSTAAFAYSVLGTYMHYGTHEVHSYLFYETAASIITLVLLGNVLEHRSVKQTTTALKELSQHQQVKAKKVDKHGDHEHIIEVDFENIKQGDVLLINTGDKIPVDGKIISGSASMDESMLTGETLPVEKQVNSCIIGGTIVVKGNIRMIAEVVGMDTALSQIIALVKRSQQNKPNIQRLGDKISAVFVPVVLAISAITFLSAHFIFHLPIQQALMNSIAVLVISCPCAMGLATPTAVMVGIGRAAKNGILIKGGSTLEEFAKIKTIVFDKTGTITTGNFKITNIQTYNNSNLNEVKALLYEIEKHSSHPIAKSVVRELASHSLTSVIEKTEELKGIGMTARDKQNNEYKITSQQVGESTHNLYLTKNNTLVAGIDIKDELKNKVAETIQQFNNSAIKTVLLSGDKKENCDAIASSVHFTEVYSQQNPLQKIEKIEQFSKKAGTVMVGDGINDAAALAKANVGISMSGATQIAIQSAQIVLLNQKSIEHLYIAYGISKHTLITIKQNLFWAFFYNIIAIPFAAFGFLTPTIGALTMALSDVVVIGNSIRLKTKKLS